MIPIGIMQGRLSPPSGGRIQSFPVNTWKDEFYIAKNLGLDYIEWVFDTATSENNPLLIDEGVAEICRLCEESQINIWSVCADYFRDYPLIRITDSLLAERLKKLEYLISQSHKAGVRRIMLPFVEGAAISTKDDFCQAINALQRVLPFAQEHHVLITLETSLESTQYTRFLESVNHPSLRVTYDIGDCASLGHDLAMDIRSLGPWLESVHVKDRLRDGVTVPLGTGSANFTAAFDTLASLKYGGAYILQCARGENGNEVETTRQNIQFVRLYLAQSMTRKY